MRWELFHNEGSGRLILIFAGWSTDASFYSHVHVNGWDTMVVWDYSSFDFPSGILDSYHTVALFAWSLGVFAASKVIPADRLALAVAINGTEYPADDSLGIPVSVFKGTADNLDERNLVKFRKRMAGADYAKIEDDFVNNDVEGLKRELHNILREALSPTSSVNAIKWDRVFISSNDRIFPKESQERAWRRQSGHPEIVMLDGNHYVDIFPIVKSIIPSKQKIGERFRLALSTYNKHATAQRSIASRLTDFIAENTHQSRLNEIVEIGSGSGIFTGLFCKRFSPRYSVFVDLYQLPKYGMAEFEDYVVADAEDWVNETAEKTPNRYDAIVSASAMQWFANPERFISDAAGLLKPDGFLAVSTFLPGNLAELSAINPFGLHYRSEDDIIQIIRKYFRNVSCEDDTIQIVFENPREVMTHLRQTGVGGASSSSLPLRQILERLPSSLTYRPLYIFASGKLDGTT